MKNSNDVLSSLFDRDPRGTLLLHGLGRPAMSPAFNEAVLGDRLTFPFASFVL